MGVAEIHQMDANDGGWLIFIEGISTAWTNIEALVGTGETSWVGTTWGVREVKPGLRMPATLPYGETAPWSATIRTPGAVSFGIIDFDGSVVALFKDQEPDETTDVLGRRLSPLDDPAPDPAEGLDGEIITLWDRHVGIECIGPAGERRQFWIAPDDLPPGLDHTGGGPETPPVLVTDSPAEWAGRKVAVYRIVQDPNTGTWPAWDDQYAGGSLWWYGTMSDRGEWRSSDQGREFVFHCLGPPSWGERSLNLARPTRWYRPSAGVTFTGDSAKVAAWIEPVDFEPIDPNDGIGYVRTLYDAQTLASGNDLSGLTTRAEIAAKIYDIVRAMVDGGTYGSVNGAATNAVYAGAVLASQGLWNDGGATKVLRRVRISNDGGSIEIKCHDGESKLGFRLGLALDVRVWQLMGWDISGATEEEVTSPSFGYDFEGAAPVGGPAWGEAEGDQLLPAFHKVGLFSTRNESDIFANQSHWDNDGNWRQYLAPYQEGTITLSHLGGDEIFVAVGEVACEGQHGQPFTLGSQIDGTDCDSAGWWIMRGQRLTAAESEAGLEPSEYITVAFCEWVGTTNGDRIAVNDEGLATIRVVRFEDPRAFGLDYDPLEEPWVNVIGQLEIAPLGVIGRITPFSTPGWRHRLVPSMLVSSGTSVWDDSGDAVVITPGLNHPADLPAIEPWPGDLEVADLGLGLPAVFVDWASWRTAINNLPGGPSGALNRAMYPLYGSVKASQILREAMAGAGLGWSWARPAGGAVPAFGAFDPLRKLSPSDAVVTLTRADMAEYEITDGPQWRGTVEVRKVGPYDRFVVEAGRSLLGGTDGRVIGEDGQNRSSSASLTVVYESQDPGRRARSGRIEWVATDGGLRDPAPWLGHAYQPLYDWTGHARDRFAAGFGPRLGKQQRIYRGIYRAHMTPLVGLGSVVRVTDPTAEASDGTRGVDHMGRVIEASIISRATGNTCISIAVELERQPVSATKVWGPAGYSAPGSWDAGTSELLLDADMHLVGGVHSDGVGWEIPEWVTSGAGQLRVAIYQFEDGETPLGSAVTADVVTVTDTILELDDITGTLYRDTIKIVVALNLADAGQVAGWPAQIFAAITDPGGTWDSGAEKGTRLL